MDHLTTAYQLGQQAAVAEFTKSAMPAAGAPVEQAAKIHKALADLLLRNPVGLAATAGGIGAGAGYGVGQHEGKPGKPSAIRGAVGGLAGGLAGLIPGGALAAAHPKLRALGMLGIPALGAAAGGALGAHTGDKPSWWSRLTE